MSADHCKHSPAKRAKRCFSGLAILCVVIAGLAYAGFFTFGGEDTGAATTAAVEASENKQPAPVVTSSESDGQSVSFTQLRTQEIIPKALDEKVEKSVEPIMPEELAIQEAASQILEPVHDLSLEALGGEKSGTITGVHGNN